MRRKAQELLGNKMPKTDIQQLLMIKNMVMCKEAVSKRRCKESSLAMPHPYP